tara:strand:- start:220 stop:546 length:327 start_codon:yes stop_codon:yes gene_type:complete
MMDLVEKIVEIKAERDMLIKENREMVSVEKLVTELLKQINWDQKLGGANVRGSAAQQQETGMFHAIRTIADISGKDFKITAKEVSGPGGKTVQEFSFDDTPPMLEPKF